MPIYEYECSACEHQFEKIQKFSDPPEKDCPECLKKGTVTKKLSASAFILNGGGWYNDGYSGHKIGKDPQEAGAKSDSNSDSKSDSKGDKAADSKSASNGGSESKSDSKSGGKAESKPESSSKSESKSESKPSAPSQPGSSPGAG